MLAHGSGVPAAYNQVVMAQELKLQGEARREAEAWCFKHGWQAFIADCRESQAGNPIAGAGVFVRSHIGATRLHSPATAGNGGCDVAPGWAVAVHLDFAMKGGIIAGSCYLESGSGLDADSTNW